MKNTCVGVEAVFLSGVSTDCGELEDARSIFFWCDPEMKAAAKATTDT
eukprot:CAMPEP_0171604342 /NCGR_PEP_ID=MMETSP0990-20121206/6562_1 /TAXON_ID=483369 /ORGANISM="non described non described, Strain CCMP2098" /LENGTH=47 /DNA_ID= /DNA_START= /DNA_END= /DNA_ORIENTATION=